MKLFDILDEADKGTLWLNRINSQSKEQEKVDDIDRQRFEKEIRLRNKEKAFSNDQTLKNGINNFLHNNVSKNMDAIDADLPAFKASMEGKSIPGSSRYLDRWKHIVQSMLADKSYKQSAAQNYLNGKTYEALGLKEKKVNYELKDGKVRTSTEYKDVKDSKNDLKAEHQGNNVVISAKDYNILRQIYPDVFKDKPHGNMIVNQSYLNKKETKDWLKKHKEEIGYEAAALHRLTKSSDFNITDGSGAKVLVTFKEVENQGGSQNNQVDDVVSTLDSLKSNFAKTEKNKAIAVIKGENIEGRLKTNDTGKVIYTKRSGEATNYWFKPITLVRKSGTSMRVPRVLTNSQWLSVLKDLKR